MFKPIRLLAAVLVLGGTATASLARTPPGMPDARPALSAPMPMPASLATGMFRQVTRLGTTKPAGAALDARGGTRPSLDAESRRLDHLIRTAVCTGC
ncbi:hypothetical protein [Methylobacterium trifolii]|uniref:Uncharacterized protein n=1 Tax=Methylobacterium trifolii TaxID=1003092 RepID=A0ABQ4TSY9_9HYPH|nr:hypothetical protein [Methylobacterium trifolii]GJE58166.1 hypothetical protein MPOCJGCO_0245 [Methylobacterium trifolii]